MYIFIFIIFCFFFLLSDMMLYLQTYCTYMNKLLVQDNKKYNFYLLHTFVVNRSLCKFFIEIICRSKYIQFSLFRFFIWPKKNCFKEILYFNICALICSRISITDSTLIATSQNYTPDSPDDYVQIKTTYCQ
jgi:hypothetical protein